jgi:hypothetical protein
MRIPLLGATLAAALLFCACAAEDGHLPNGDRFDTTLPVLDDPFEFPRPDDHGLTNTSADLFELLERGSLQGACDLYRAEPTNTELKLRCGKYQFFYESFGTGGVPEVLVQFVLENFPNQVGPAFSKQGMIPDPTSADGLPLGLAPGTEFAGQRALSYTCASCHVGQLPDGRYSVGAPNLDYEYGKQMLLLTILPRFANPLDDPADHHPDAIAAIQSALDDFTTLKKAKFVFEILPLAFGALWHGESVPALSWEDEGHYASWKPGTMDFTMAPLPINDGVHTVSKILDLWDIPSEGVARAYAPGHTQLSWTGSVPSVHAFLQGFAIVGAAPDATDLNEEIAPLAAYLETLRAPVDLAMDRSAPSISEGEGLFYKAGCADCHSGPAGSGIDIYSFDEIGTDEAIMYWADPELTGEPCCGIPSLAPLTNGIKAPRLTGAWAKSSFLHNGSVDSLEELFCVNSERPTIEEPVFSDRGHRMTCDGLSPGEKLALISWLKSL